MVQKILSTTPELEKVQSEYVEFMTDVALRAEALSHEMWLHDQASHKAEARREGLAEGLAVKAKEMAKKMRDKGFDIAEISEITGLSEKEIQLI